MAERESDRVFSDDVADAYEEFLVPLIFEPYAADLARRLSGSDSTAILEVAAGTGVATRALASALPATVAVTATDLNQAMLDRAMSVGTSRPVSWEQADVMSLPYGDATFDVVVCQFGVMFFPAKPGAFAEVHRVLRPGGQFLFNVWDRIEHNEFADVVTDAVRSMFPDDPPRFLRRTPHGYHDPEMIRADLRAAGFDSETQIDPLDARSRAAAAHEPAVGYCQGTPLRDEIEARGPGRLAEATDTATEAVARRFGRTDLDSRISAWVVSTVR